MFVRSLFAVAVLPATIALAQPAANLHQLKEDASRATINQSGLENRITALFSKKDLEAGTAKPKIDGLIALWAYAGPGEARVQQLDHEKPVEHHALKPIVVGSRIQVLFLELPNFSEKRFSLEVRKPGSDWRSQGTSPVRTEHFPTHPDNQAKPDVPKGKLTKHFWNTSQVFPGTERDWWIYVPAQYRADGPPACLMVFQDGEGYTKTVPTVFDNLIHKGELPVIVGVFINPGVISKPGSAEVRNRSFEYDTLSDAYARFLRDEILPEVEKTVKLRSDPASRAICGRSSGGICAFTVAWEMPNRFGKVLSAVGSFTNIRGGDVYPGRIRKTPAKPIRVFLQDGTNDLDNEHGNWWLGNQQMAKALAFKGYDYNFVTGEGFHSGKHETAIFPDALRWLWRGYQP